jgi:hypothetical protein
MTARTVVLFVTLTVGLLLVIAPFADHLAHAAPASTLPAVPRPLHSRETSQAPVELPCALHCVAHVLLLPSTVAGLLLSSTGRLLNALRSFPDPASAPPPLPPPRLILARS